MERGRVGVGRKLLVAGVVVVLALVGRARQRVGPHESIPQSPTEPRQVVQRRSPENRESSQPYGSALDLPSMAELLRNIEGMKGLTRFVARDQRATVIDLERQIRRLGEVVDRFYGLLGDRNWIFHDDLEVTFVEGLVDMPVDAAERALIEHYEDAEALRFKVRRLGRFPELQARMHLLERAEADFLAGRYYAAVQVLLSVMDGFVNDLDPGERRGLHAREADELHAWDSVVGHHLGLAQAHESFSRTFRKRSDEPVRELYRNGIVHGMLTNYDNDVVAAKAWNRLFAVADWASSRQKRDRPPKERASWREVLRTIARNEETRRALDAWRPSSLAVEGPGFDDDEVVAATTQYLDAWRRRNYGLMAGMLSPLVADTSAGGTAGQVREAFGDRALADYRLDHVDHPAAAVGLVDAVLQVDGTETACRLRWIRTGAYGLGAAPNEEATWRLITWTFEGMAAERTERHG